MRSDRPNPVMRGPAKWRGRGDIERRVLRRIRKQAERQQNAQCPANESNEFVNAAIFCHLEDAHVSLLGCWGRPLRRTGRAGAVARLLRGGTRPKAYPREAQFNSKSIPPACELANTVPRENSCPIIPG